MTRSTVDAAFVAAVLIKLGETNITISKHDLESLPVGRVQTFADEQGDITVRILREPDPNQAELPLTGERGALPSPLPGPHDDCVMCRGDIRRCVC